MKKRGMTFLPTLALTILILVLGFQARAFCALVKIDFEQSQGYSPGCSIDEEIQEELKRSQFSTRQKAGPSSGSAFCL